MRSVACRRCGWIHFEVTRRDAESEIARFNSYFYSLPEEKRKTYYGDRPSSLENYMRCVRCGASYKEFGKATEEQRKKSYGCTINPILKTRSKHA